MASLSIIKIFSLLHPSFKNHYKDSKRGLVEPQMPPEGHSRSPNIRFLCPKGICLKTKCPKGRCLKTVCLKGTMPYDCMPQRDYALWLYASKGICHMTVCPKWICLITVCPKGICLLTGCQFTAQPICYKNSDLTMKTYEKWSTKSLILALPVTI